MMSGPKIRIDDSVELRSELSGIVDGRNQKVLALWARAMAERITMEFPESDAVSESTVALSETVDGFMDGTMSVGEIRRRGLEVHALARDAEGAEQAAIRTIGQALSVCHMREHALVASDYAVRTVNLLRPGDIGAVVDERNAQIRDLSDLA